MNSSSRTGGEGGRYINLLGKRVEIKSVKGTIRKEQHELHDNGITITTTHFINFDDGYSGWFNLKEEKSLKRLKWLNNKNSAIIGKNNNNNSTTTNNYVDLVESEEDDTTNSKTNPKKVTQKKRKAGPSKEKNVQKKRSKEWTVENASSLSSSDLDDQETTDEDNKDNDDDDNNDSCSSSSSSNSMELPDVIPSSIDEMIRYLDKIEPDVGWFDIQKDSRNGCSKTRRKLRDFAKKNPTNIAVQHWIKTGNWEPPNHKALSCLLNLIKDLIQ